jgi:probable F420-dependent oxidoreductase
MSAGPGIRLAVTLSHLGGWTRPKVADLLTLASIADTAGVDQVVLSEHVLLAREITGHPSAAGTASSGGGSFPFPSDEEYPEPLAALAAMAGVTTRCRLSTNILIAPVRPAALLAKTAATVDVLCGGRLDLGLGVGWHAEEFAALGVSSRRPGRRLEETIGACRVLWRGGPSTYEGETVSFRDMYSSPTPVQDPLPIWLAGGPTVATMSRIARLGDGWSPIGGTSPDEIRLGAGLLRKLAADRGRDPSSFTIRASLPAVRDRQGRADLAATVRGADPYVDAGAEVVQLPPLGQFITSLDHAASLLEEAVRLVQAIC